jgi:hypothetical protein
MEQNQSIEQTNLMNRIRFVPISDSYQWKTKPIDRTQTNRRTSTLRNKHHRSFPKVVSSPLLPRPFFPFSLKYAARFSLPRLPLQKRDLGFLFLSIDRSAGTSWGSDERRKIKRERERERRCRCFRWYEWWATVEWIRGIQCDAGLRYKSRLERERERKRDWDWDKRETDISWTKAGNPLIRGNIRLAYLQSSAFASTTPMDLNGDTNQIRCHCGDDFTHILSIDR